MRVCARDHGERRVRRVRPRLVCGTDVGEMVDALNVLARDDSLRAQLATRGASFAERFDWSASGERFARRGASYLAAAQQQGFVSPDP